MSAKGLGCYSMVGMITSLPSQQLQLEHPGCTSVGTVMHEIAHALGEAHEQSRTDRDKYVKIFWGNIAPTQKHNFDIAQGSDVARPYDFLSVMHYDPYAFSI